MKTCFKLVFRDFDVTKKTCFECVLAKTSLKHVFIEVPASCQYYGTKRPPRVNYTAATSSCYLSQSRNHHKRNRSTRQFAITVQRVGSHASVNAVDFDDKQYQSTFQTTTLRPGTLRTTHHIIARFNRSRDSLPHNYTSTALAQQVCVTT